MYQSRGGCLADLLSAALCMQAKSDNQLLQVRGNAGTHDLQLGKQTLRALQVSMCLALDRKLVLKVCSGTSAGMPPLAHWLWLRSHNQRSALCRVQ